MTANLFIPGRRVKAQHLPKGSSDVSTTNEARRRNGERRWRPCAYALSKAYQRSIHPSTVSITASIRSLSVLCSFKKYLPVADHTTLIFHDCAYQIPGTHSCTVILHMAHVKCSQQSPGERHSRREPHFTIKASPDTRPRRSFPSFFHEPSPSQPTPATKHSQTSLRSHAARTKDPAPRMTDQWTQEDGRKPKSSKVRSTRPRRIPLLLPNSTH